MLDEEFLFSDLLFMHYEEDEKTYDIQYQYLFGEDVLVAPVHQENQTEWKYIYQKISGSYVWSGEEYTGGSVTVQAPLGYPPVFYRKIYME